MIYSHHEDKSGILSKIYRFIFCKKASAIPENLLLLGKYDPEFKQPDEPSNIKWENLDFSDS